MVSIAHVLKDHYHGGESQLRVATDALVVIFNLHFRPLQRKYIGHVIKPLTVAPPHQKLEYLEGLGDVCLVPSLLNSCYAPCVTREKK